VRKIDEDIAEFERDEAIKKAKELLKQDEWTPPPELKGSLHTHNIPDCIVWDETLHRIKSKIDYD
jgi:hypothetical protein